MCYSLKQSVNATVSSQKLQVKNTFIQFDEHEQPSLRRANSAPSPSALSERAPLKRKHDELEEPNGHGLELERSKTSTTLPSRTVSSTSGKSNDADELTPEMRHEKRANYIASIMKTPGYGACLASKARGQTETRNAPETPDASDQKLSKRQWEKVCREWRTALKEFGDVARPGSA